MYLPCLLMCVCMYTYIVCADHLSTIEDKEKSKVDEDGTEQTRDDGTCTCRVHVRAVATL